MLVVLTGAGTTSVAQQPPGDTPDPSITNGAATKALRAAKARWRAKGAPSYRLRVARSCFCLPDSTRARTVTVHGGRSVRAPDAAKDIATVPRLFRKVRVAIADEVHDLNVRYDTRTGYPRSIAIDGHAFIADDEITYSASRLQRLRPRRR